MAVVWGEAEAQDTFLAMRMQFLTFVLVILCVLKPLNLQPDSAKSINFIDVLEKTGLDYIP